MRLTANRFVILIACLATSLTFANDEAGKAAYAPCAACHLPDGVGIPGAFPPIQNRAAEIAALAGGREYLVTVVSYGLMGTIEINGAQYFGVMAGNVGTMSAKDIADVLNYIVDDLSDVENSVEAFTEEEVAAVQAATVEKSPQTGGTLRQQLVEEHASNWP